MKPCPFCGGEPKVRKEGGSDERTGYGFKMHVECTCCGASLSRHSHTGKAGWCDDTGQALKAVTEAWNMRSHRETLQ